MRYKNISLILLPVLLLIGSPNLYAQSKGQPKLAKKIYCWVDKGGSRICSDAPQPESNQYDKTTISSKTGMKIGEVERQLTAQEIQAHKEQAQRIIDEQKRIEEISKQQKRIAQRYNSLEELNISFDVKKDEIVKNIEFTQSNLLPMRKQLVSKLKDISDLEMEDKKISNKLHNDLLEHRDNIKQQQKYVTSRKQDLVNLEIERRNEILVFSQANGITNQVQTTNQANTISAPTNTGILQTN